VPSVKPGSAAPRFIPCREIIALLSEYIDGSLPAERARALEDHLAICPPCIDFLESLRKTRGAAGTLREEAIPAECRRRLRDFLARNLKVKAGSPGS